MARLSAGLVRLFRAQLVRDDQREKGTAQQQTFPRNKLNA
jgi:hypothetical protein